MAAAGMYQSLPLRSSSIASLTDPFGVVLFLYDSVVTIGDEMRFIWGRRLTSAIVLFHLNKYLLILYYALLFVTFLGQLSDEVSDTLSISPDYCVRYYLGCSTSSKLIWSPTSLINLISRTAVQHSRK